MNWTGCGRKRSGVIWCIISTCLYWARKTTKRVKSTEERNIFEWDGFNIQHQLCTEVFGKVKNRIIAQAVRHRLLTAETWINPWWLQVRSLVDKWHWSRFSPQLFCFPPLITIPPLLHNHLSPPHEVCDSPDQAAHYHSLGPKLGASSLTGTWLVSG
jgi:hypothetical protein